MKKYLYLATTKDEYELPLAVEDSPSELARKLGGSARAISSAISHGYKGFFRVEIEGDNDEQGSGEGFQRRIH